MIVKHDVHIQGRFKFDLYDKSGNFKNSSDYFSNFITPTGLLVYPTILPFADCFRYISVGSGTSANTILGNGTTGLSQPISKFSYIGGNLEEIGQANQYEINGCGYREHRSGVSLFRAWRLPTGDSNFFDQNYTFKEFMLTPGQPLDITSGCNELPDLLSNYPTICSLTKAFTRVIKDISVSQNDYLIAYYELNVTSNTGVSTFKINVDNAGRSVGSDASNWGGNISGASSIVHHGMKLIRGENVNSIPFYIDQTYSYNHYGDSFNPSLGSPLEPSTPKNEYVVYLSTDDTQFLVSELSGAAMDTGTYFPYNLNGKPFPSGVEYFHVQPSLETSMGNNIPYWLKNIRKGGGGFFPCADDYTTSCDESNIGLTLNSINASSTTNVKYNTIKTSDRNRTRSISVEFDGINAGSIVNQPIRSLVMSYRSTDGSNLFPFFDSIFASKTDGLLPAIYTGITGYSPSSNGFSYLDGINNLTLQFQLTWASPCDPTVLGC